MKTKLETVAQAQQMLTKIRALREDPIWAGEVAPWLAEMKVAEADAHEAVGKTPAERSEHLFSMKLLREATGLLDELERGVRKWIAENREMQT